MSKKRKPYKENLLRVGDFGKDLARRSKSKCELCEASKVKLTIYEVPPAPTTPDFNNCIFICDHCLNLIFNIDTVKENDLRFLEGPIWSETEIIKATSIALLKTAENKFSWISDSLENIYIDSQLEDKISKIKF